MSKNDFPDRPSDRSDSGYDSEVLKKSDASHRGGAGDVHETVISRDSARHPAYDSGSGVGMVPSGWLAFAGLMLLLVGCFNLIEGLAILFRPTQIALTAGQALVLDHSTWGWILLLIGAVQVLTSVGVMNGRDWARGVGIGFAVFNALTHLTLITVFPWWSVLAIAVNVMVIYGLTAPMERARYA